MAQYQVNRELAVRYARMARSGAMEECSAWSAIRWIPVPGGAGGEQPGRDGPVGRRRAVFPIRCGASDWGVMQARAMYYARKEPRFCRLSDGGAYLRPHGADLVAASSIEHYDDALSVN